MTREMLYKIAFASVRGMGVDLARKMLEVIGEEQEFFRISEKALQKQNFIKIVPQRLPHQGAKRASFS